MRLFLKTVAVLAVGLVALLIVDAAHHRPAPAAVDSFAADDAAPETEIMISCGPDIDPFAADNAAPATVLVMGLAKAHAVVPNVKLDCSCGPDCDCVAGECGNANCPSLKVVAAPKKKKADACTCDCDACTRTYARGVYEAKRRGKPLMVFAGCCCPALEKATSECVHCYVEKLEGKPVPYVAVLHFHGNEYVSGMGWPGLPTAEQVNAFLHPQPARKEEPPVRPVLPAALLPRLTIAPPMQFAPMPMMGGFGFGGGGGGGGGGC